MCADRLSTSIQGSRSPWLAGEAVGIARGSAATRCAAGAVGRRAARGAVGESNTGCLAPSFFALWVVLTDHIVKAHIEPRRCSHGWREPGVPVSLGVR